MSSADGLHSRHKIRRRYLPAEWTSIGFGLIILGFFVADLNFGFDPSGDTLAWSIFFAAMAGLFYLAVQFLAITSRVGNDSSEVARDSFFSFIPPILLVTGLMLKVVPYYLLTDAPVVSSLETFSAWLRWLFGALTQLEYMVLAILLFVEFIDIYIGSDIMNRVTAAARSESRTA